MKPNNKCKYIVQHIILTVIYAAHIKNAGIKILIWIQALENFGSGSYFVKFWIRTNSHWFIYDVQ